jgi:hypothetical protein
MEGGIDVHTYGGEGDRKSRLVSQGRSQGLRSVVEGVMEGVLYDPEAEDRAAEDILLVAESVPGKDLAYGVCSIRSEWDRADFRSQLRAS